LSPLRILILFGLFYVLFRLLAGAGSSDKVSERTKPAETPDAAPTQDILMEDPVCRTLIPARRAITWTNKGKILYFCSEECRSQFITSQGDRP